MDAQDLDNRFAYHAPSGPKKALHELVRTHCRNLAALISDAAPQSREQSLAITALEEAMMWANAAIARHPLEDENPNAMGMSASPMGPQERGRK